MFCTNCGKKVPFKTRVCPFCNEQILAEDEHTNSDETQENAMDLSSGTDVENAGGDQENLDIYENSQYNPDLEYGDSTYSEPFCSKYDMPLSTSSFFFMQIVLLIPIVNLLLLLIWSFRKKTNSNRRSYARSMLIWFLAFSVILLFVFITMIFMRYPIDLGFWFSEFKSFINSIPEF